MSTVELSWIDEFIEKVRPYIFVRMEDLLLIKRPNQVQKLNLNAATILKSLLDGASIKLITKNLDERKKKDIYLFFHALKNQLEGNQKQLFGHPAIDVHPFKEGPFKLPVLSELAVTYRCNLKCNFCYAGANSNCSVLPDKEEMNTEQMKSVIYKIFHDSQVPSISFTGGEPTLLTELPELITFAKNLGMRVNLITNGTLLTRELAQRYHESGLDSAQVSLEATYTRLHDKITGVNKSFLRSLAGIKHLVKADIHTHTNTTLSSHNVDNCLEMPGFVKNVLGLERFSMNMMIPVGTATKDTELTVKYSEIGQYIDIIKQNAKDVGVEFMWYSPVPMCIYNTISNNLGNKGCSACDGLLSIACNGDVLPCSSYPEPVGNILHKDFSEVWEGAVATKIRKKQLAPEVCLECEKFSMCHGSCPLYWDKIGTDELHTQNVLTKRESLQWTV
ncbi:MAG: radical SAM protein [Bacteriovoracaceae bacterium]|nr:radical SAM protein [Bacteriovoracaceae bacterium]